MRCGICKSDSPTFEPRGWQWRPGDVVSAIPVYDAGNLVTHKRQQHPEEYAASLKARKDTKAADEAADQDYRQRRVKAGLAAGRDVLYRNPYYDDPPVVQSTTYIGDWQHVEHFRYPEPATFQEYKDTLRTIAELEAKAAIALLSAFEHGAPVPQADVDQVRAAMDAVGKEE